MSCSFSNTSSGGTVVEIVDITACRERLEIEAARVLAFLNGERRGEQVVTFSLAEIASGAGLSQNDLRDVLAIMLFRGVFADIDGEKNKEGVYVFRFV